MKPTIYTFGYTGSSPEDLKGYMQALDAILVDVRMSPYSRAPHWTGASLRVQVGDDRYIGCPQLGNRNYNKPGPIELFAPEIGLRMVRALLQHYPVILLCGCQDVVTCHRKVAADYLACELGADVVHLPTKFKSWQRISNEREIRCLTLTQPWASLVAVGAKHIETRSWKTDYRGLLAIHAAKAWTEDDQMLLAKEPFRTPLRNAGYHLPHHLPRGFIVALCELVDCVQVLPGLPRQPFMLTSTGIRLDVQIPPEEPELSFGNYGLGRYAWVLANILRLDEPIPARGYQSLWVPDEELKARIEAVVPEVAA
ncbi:MAG TPA: hypothetical protein VF914_21720 [Chloroflexia bacterium]|jgi:hypothetical protein